MYDQYEYIISNKFNQADCKFRTLLTSVLYEVVYQKSKKFGVTYVYRNEPYWDKEKQQSRTKRTLLGKLDPETGEIIPTRVYQSGLTASVVPSNGITSSRGHMGDVLKSTRREYLHLFYNPEKAARDQLEMNEYLTSLSHDLMENERKDYRMKGYNKYFEVTQTSVRGRKITPNEDTMHQAARNYGYFALLSIEVKDPFEALSLYQSKDIAEKGLANLKDRLNFSRMNVSSELSLNGKLFVDLWY